MSRTRVHNLNVSLDGYAAGEHITLEAPIGGAEQLFAGFDGRVIHSVQHGKGPITAAHALTATWSQGVGAEIMGRRKFGPQSGPWGEAKEAANGQDVRLGGGPTTIRQFLQADLVDFMHLAIQPIVLGRGVSLWAGLGDVHERFDIQSIATPDGRIHQLWNRTTD